MNRLRFCILASFTLFAAASALGQTSQGTIAGTITDPMGAAVPGATVEARNNTGSEDRTVMTGPNGEYRVDAVTPSTYTISVTKTGFSKKEIKDIVVPASVVTSVNAELALGDVSQTVTVEAGGAATIQTESGELSASITSQEVSQMPIITGNPIDLVLTLPGVVSVSSRDHLVNGEGFVADGLRPRSNNFLIDGFDNNDYGITGQALQPSNLEAIKEVNIQTNSYAAEFGRGGSSITNVIYKNGTNDWHGAGWDRYSASAITAIPVELRNQGVTVSPQFVENVFGFDIGGPVVKNKLFVFGSSQWDHNNYDESGAQFTIPTAAGVASLQSIGPNANAAILVSSLGGLTAPASQGTINIGNRAGCGSPCLISVGQVIRSPKAISRSYQWITRADYSPTANDTVMARYIGSHNSLTPDLFANPGALPTQDTLQGGPARGLGIYWTHVLSPTKVNEARFTAQQINFTFGPLASTSASPLEADPNITINGLGGPSTTFGGLTPTFPQGRAHNTYQYQDAFSWTFKNHSVKMGVDLIHLGVTDTLPFNNIGTATFTAGGDCSAIGLANCTALANFLDNFTGPSGTTGRSFGSPFLAFPQTLQAYYAQDTWKLRPNFTLTYGLRYEYQGTPLNALAFPTVPGGILAPFAPETKRFTQQPDKNNFGPRFGFAYSPSAHNRIVGDNKTVIRGGFGTFYDPLFSNIGDNAQEGPPNTLGGLLVSPKGANGRGTAGALGLVNGVTPSLSPRSSVTTEVSNLVNPLIYQWNFDIERSLPGKFLVTVAYVGTRGERLYLNEEMNPGINDVRINPARGSILARTNLGNSSYHGLDLSVDRSLGHGFMMRAAYTVSKNLDNGSDVFTTSSDTTRPQNLFNSSLEKGPSAFDRRQRAVVSWIYQTPAFKTTGIGKALSWPVRDWQISGIFSWQTGAPETIYLGGFDQNGDLSAANDRPNLSNINAPINYSTACLSSPTCISGIGQTNPDGSFSDWNTGAPGTASQFRYIVTSDGSFIGPSGNLGRNTFYNPGRQDYSLALQRIIRIPHFESHQFEFRAEAFDVFNHPNAGGGTTQDGSSVPGISGNIDSPLFNNKDVTFEGGRALQLWLKYRF